MHVKKGFSKNRSWISFLTMKSKILPDWKMALDELLKASEPFQTSVSERAWARANEPRDVIHFQLPKTVTCFHTQGLFKLSALGSSLRSWLWLPVTHLLPQGGSICERLRLLPHLSIISWSSHGSRIVGQRINYGTVLIRVTVELVYAFIDIMRPNSKEKGVLNPAGQCKLFPVGPIFSIPLCLFLARPATVSYKT